MERKNTEKLIFIVLTTMFSLVALLLFINWGKTQGNTVDFEMTISFISLVLFMFPLFFAFKKFSGELMNPEAQGEILPQVSKDIKRYDFLRIVSFLLVFDIAVVILIGAGYKLFSDNSQPLATAIESIFRKLDSNQYLYIAENWYTNNGTVETDVSLVFLPGYPLLVKFFGLLTGQYFWTSMALSAIFFAFAGGFLYLLASYDKGREYGLRCVLYFALLPGVFFFAAPMTESLFLMLTFGSIYFMRSRRWLPAGLMGMYAAFTRSAGIFLVIVFVYELALEFWNGEHTTARLKEALLNLISVVLIPMGLFYYLLINKLVTGDWFKFLYYQKNHWGQGLGYFWNTVKYMLSYLTSYVKDGNLTSAIGLWLMGLTAIFTLLVLLNKSAKKMRTSYLIYSLAYFVFSMGATWLLSAPRYAIGLFTLPMMIAGSEEKEDKLSIVAKSVVLGIFSVLYGIMFIQRWQVW